MIQLYEYVTKKYKIMQNIFEIVFKDCVCSLMEVEQCLLILPV